MQTICCNRGAAAFYRTIPFVIRRKSTIRSLWPHLTERFHEIENDDGVVALLPPVDQRVVDRKTANSEKTAAVLVLLVMVDETPSLVFTQRSAHLSQHAAQISFPGGHREDGDTSLIDTAVREAKEELHLEDAGNTQWPDLKILGKATPVPSIRGVPVIPVIGGLVDKSFASPVSNYWPGNPSEVDFVFTVPVAELIANETTKALKATKFNSASPSAPVFMTPQGSEIWGLTAYVLKPLLHNLFHPVICPGIHKRGSGL